MNSSVSIMEGFTEDASEYGTCLYICLTVAICNHHRIFKQKSNITKVKDNSINRWEELGD